MIHKETPVEGGSECVRVRIIEDTFQNSFVETRVETRVGQPTCLTFCHVMTGSSEQLNWTRHRTGHLDTVLLCTSFNIIYESHIKNFSCFLMNNIGLIYRRC